MLLNFDMYKPHEKKNKLNTIFQIIYLHRQSAYLIGRLAHVCEIPVDHPSCSKQHAALQFRYNYFVMTHL